MNFRKTLLALGLTIATASANAITLGGLIGDSAFDSVHDTNQSQVQIQGSTSIASFLFEFTLPSESSVNEFGIYDNSNGGDIDISERLAIFEGADSPTSGSNALNPFTSEGISFDAATQTASAGGSEISTDGTFGFYVKNSSGDYLYSDAADNGGTDYALLFDTSGLSPFDVVIGFEDVQSSLITGYDFDFEDLVIGMTNVTPVPLPGAALLFGAGIGVLGLARRRKAKAEAEKDNTANALTA